MSWFCNTHVNVNIQQILNGFSNIISTGKNRTIDFGFLGTKTFEINFPRKNTNGPWNEVSIKYCNI